MRSQVKSVKIAELKNRLSYYLRRVQQGETLLVSNRERVIARIDRVSAPPSGGDAGWLARLEGRGVLRRGPGKLSAEWLAARPAIGVDLVAAVRRERDEGR